MDRYFPIVTVILRFCAIVLLFVAAHGVLNALFGLVGTAQATTQFKTDLGVNLGAFQDSARDALLRQALYNVVLSFVAFGVFRASPWIAGKITQETNRGEVRRG